MKEWDVLHTLCGGDLTRLPVILRTPRRITLAWLAAMNNAQPDMKA